MKSDDQSMNAVVDSTFKHIQFYLTSSYPCSYLDEHTARSQVASPSYAIDTTTYSHLIRLGFRRSGLFTYRPCCDSCQACVPMRVLTQAFQPNRSQKRTQTKHQTLTTKLLRPSFQTDHYALFMRYQAARHPDGGMNNDSIEQYTQFLLKSQVESYLVEFSEPTTQTVKAVMLIDVVEDGVSAVYTFYEPELHCSYGTYAVLWAIEFAKQHHLPYVYLGYWIAQSEKMNYKSGFVPSEVYAHTRRQWVAYAKMPPSVSTAVDSTL